MRNPIITTSWDDGHPLDSKLSSLLLKNKIPGTFYIPLTNQENPVMNHEYIKNLSQNFEIGGHTLNHKVLTLLNDDEINYEISKGKEELEKICGEVNSFAYSVASNGSSSFLLPTVMMEPSRTFLLFSQRLYFTETPLG